MTIIMRDPVEESTPPAKYFRLGGRSKASNLSVAAQREAAPVKNRTETKLEIMR